MDGKSLTEEYINLVQQYRDIYYEDYKKAKEKAKKNPMLDIRINQCHFYISLCFFY